MRPHPAPDRQGVCGPGAREPHGAKGGLACDRSLQLPVSASKHSMRPTGIRASLQRAMLMEQLPSHFMVYREAPLPARPPGSPKR